MVVFDVVLRNLAVIRFEFLCQEVHAEGFLKQRVTFVFLVPQHRGFDTSTSLHPHPINEGVKRGEGG